MNADRFTYKSREALQGAHELATKAGNPELVPEHLLAALLTQQGGIVPSVLARTGTDVRDLVLLVSKELERLPRQEGGSPARSSRRFQTVLGNAEEEAKKGGEEYVSTEHLLLGILDEGQGAAYDLLRTHGASRDAVAAATKEVKGAQKADNPDPEGTYAALEKYTVDLTERAREGKIDPVIGRDAEIRRVMQVLTRRTKNNPVLIGAPGTGKTAIAEGLARRVVAGDVPESLKRSRLLALDLGRCSRAPSSAASSRSA